MITCLGILVADLICKTVNQIPEEGKLALVDDISVHTGGCALNSAIDLAKLGVKSRIIGAVGDDPFGAFLMDEMRRYDIDHTGVSKIAGQCTSSSIVLSHANGERSFLHTLGSNASLSADHIDMALLLDSDLLFIAGALLLPGIDGAPTARLLEAARKNSVLTVLDTAWNENSGWMDSIKPSLAHLDVFIPSFDEAKRLSQQERVEEMAACFLALGAKNVVIKMGGQGCFLKNANESKRFEAFKVKAVDTTGAGDAFVAGFIFGMSQHWPMEECAIFANAVGAFCVQKVGASTGVENASQVMQFIRNHGTSFQKGLER